jgi:hypothetical protein
MLSQSIGTALAQAQLLMVQTIILQTNTTDQLPCEPSSGLQPLFDFLNSITELAFLAGVGLATLTFVVAGICLILPGQDYTRLGKKIAKNGLVGAILLLSANMITSYLVSQLGANICA